MSEAIRDSGEVPDGYEEVEFGPKTLVVPSDWTVESFGEVFQRRKESIEAENGQSVRYVGLEHLDSGELDLNGYEENGLDRSSSRAFREGDVLFGKLRPNLNKAAIAPFGGICSSDIIPIYSADPTLQQYLPYLMHSEIVRDRVVSTMEGTNLPRTSWSDLEKILIPLPPKPEQRRIADILSTVDRQIQQSKEFVELTQEVRKGVLNEVIQKGRGARQGDKIKLGPKSLIKPNDWEITSIGEVADVTVGHVSSISEHYSREGEIPVLSTKNISESGILLSDVYRVDEEFDQNNIGSRANPGDIIMARHGDGGICAQVPESIGQVQCLNVVIIKPKTIDSDFLQYQMNLKETRKRLMSMAGGSVQSVVNTGTIRSFKIVAPPEEEQLRIANIGNTIKKALDDGIRQKQKLIELKRGLMQDLLTGKVRVNPDNAD